MGACEGILYWEICVLQILNGYHTLVCTNLILCTLNLMHLAAFLVSLFMLGEWTSVTFLLT